MKNIKTHVCAASVALLLGAVGSVAQSPVSIKARVDSVDVLQGRLRTVDVEIVQDASVKDGRWTVDIPAAAAGHDKAPRVIELVSGVELHTKGIPDTLDLGNNRIQINRRLLIQPFDSGDVVLPGFEYIVGADTFRSNALALKVYTADVDTMTTVHALAPAINAPRHFWDWVPDFIADYWWIYLLCIVAVAGVYFGWKIYHKGGIGRLVKPAPKPVPPYERAMNELENLRSRKLCEKGQEREFYTQLTEILREYLEGRFGINAMEMTTTQIKAAVRSNSTTARSSAQMNEILEMADFVKFAKMRPLPEDNVRVFTQSVNFVENTKPEEMPAEDASAQASSAAGKEARP